VTLEAPTTTGAAGVEPPVIGGRYAVREALGRGGAATVYRALDLKLEREVALKVFASDDMAGTDEERRARRTREICLLARANHPNLVTLFDADWDRENAGTEYIVMELVRGMTLRQRLRADGADPVLAAQLATELGAALAYLHADGIIHRDLKPENILLDTRSEGGVMTKLVDFGIAQLLGDERLTSDRSILGTAAYLAPEQVAGRGAVAATDVYALGLVLLECLTGERSFPGGTVEAAVARMTQDPPLPVELDPAWRQLLLAMTARDPEARPTAAEVAETAAVLTHGMMIAAGARADAGVADVTVAAATPATPAIPAAPQLEPVAGPEVVLVAASEPVPASEHIAEPASRRARRREPAHRAPRKAPPIVAAAAAVIVGATMTLAPELSSIGDLPYDAHGIE
jgi:eukaryotic-like serine/threonine-protein kinase